MVDTATVSQLAHLGAGIAIDFGAVGAGLVLVLLQRFDGCSFKTT